MRKAFFTIILVAICAICSMAQKASVEYNKTCNGKDYYTEFGIEYTIQKSGTIRIVTTFTDNNGHFLVSLDKDHSLSNGYFGNFSQEFKVEKGQSYLSKSKIMNGVLINHFQKGHTYKAIMSVYQDGEHVISADPIIINW